MSKLITPSVETETINFTFAGVNNPDGSIKLFTAQTQVEALQQLLEYQKTLLPTQTQNN